MTNRDEVDPDADLRMLGLGSLRLVALIVDIEATLGVSFPAVWMRDETFRNIRAMVQAIEALQREPA